MDGRKTSLKSWDAIKHELQHQGKTDVLKELETALAKGQKIKAHKLARAQGIKLQQ